MSMNVPKMQTKGQPFALGDTLCVPHTSTIRGSGTVGVEISPQQCQGTFVAIDFETANRFRNSACAIGVVRVEEGVVRRVFTQLIRPPKLDFEFTYIHGIGPQDVQEAPTYNTLHTEILELLEGAQFIAAHNAPFDASVMRSLCSYWGLCAPDLPWACTVKIARKAWGLFPTKLPDVCQHLNIPLQHHDATSDALACAKIVLAYGTLDPRSCNTKTVGL